MSTTIYFDMDGTVYNLYGLNEWLEKIQEEKKNVFSADLPLFAPSIFYDTVTKLLHLGVKFGVITWLPMGATPEYEEICRREKNEWCKKYLPFISSFVAQTYGTPKQQAITKHAKTEILIDDNKEVCEIWNTEKQRKSINISGNYDDVTKALRQILNDIQ